MEKGAFIYRAVSVLGKSGQTEMFFNDPDG